MVNKELLLGARFHFPTALTLLHYAVTWLGLWLCRRGGVFAERKVIGPPCPRARAAAPARRPRGRASSGCSRW